MNLPLDFLLSASRASLEDFELSRLNHADQLAKRLREMIRELIDEHANAIVARLLLETDRLRSIGVNPLQEVFDFTQQGGPGGAAQTRDTKPFASDLAAD